MVYQLYGDGVHDDYPAIQEMIDSGVSEVVLPMPKEHYLISQTLSLPSNFRLVLPRFAEIRLADGANCFMVKNKTVQKPLDRHPVVPEFFYYSNEFSPDEDDCARNIEISGGIWNLNNKGQNPNPLQTCVYEPKGYNGMGMLFYNVRNLKLSCMTLKNPVNFAVTFDIVSYFTVEDITFDFNYGNPNAVNMDGIHLDGNCHYGVIRNLKGACYDDLVALNADEGSNGPITNIQIDGIFAEKCHSAVRLLTMRNAVEKIHISNVYGTYYQYAFSFTRYRTVPGDGYFDAITIDNAYVSKSERHSDYCNVDSDGYALIFIQANTTVKNLKISDLHRKENNYPIETILVQEGAVVERLILDNVTTQNNTGKDMPCLVNNGTVGTVVYRNCETGGDEILVNHNIVGCVKGCNE